MYVKKCDLRVTAIESRGTENHKLTEDNDDMDKASYYIHQWQQQQQHTIRQR